MLLDIIFTVFWVAWLLAYSRKKLVTAADTDNAVQVAELNIIHVTGDFCW